MKRVVVVRRQMRKAAAKLTRSEAVKNPQTIVKARSPWELDREAQRQLEHADPTQDNDREVSSEVREFFARMFRPGGGLPPQKHEAQELDRVERRQRKLARPKRKGEDG